MCTRPTIINVYQLGENNIVKRYYNLTNKEAIEHLAIVNKYYVIPLSKKDQERCNSKNKTELVRCVSSQMIDCGECEECAREISKHIAQRIILELKEAKTEAYFITLTYADECLPYGLQTKDAQNFILAMKKDAPKLRYLIAGEYGSTTQRPHYHAIIWNTDGVKINKQWAIDKGKDHINYYFTSKYWTKGYSTIATADPASIYYTCQYALKKTTRSKEEKEKLEKAGITPEFRYLSRNIAHNYYKAHEEEIDKNKGYILLENGQHIKVDRSYIKYKLKNGKEKPEYMQNIPNTINISIEKPHDKEQRSIRK